MGFKLGSDRMTVALLCPKAIRQKIGSDEMDWKKRAEALFFVDGIKIGEISEALGVSRRSISAHLNSVEGYRAKRGRTKTNTEESRREYQRNWDREHRPYRAISDDMLRTEHDLAALILSRERHCYESGV